MELKDYEMMLRRWIKNVSNCREFLKLTVWDIHSKSRKSLKHNKSINVNVNSRFI